MFTLYEFASSGNCYKLRLAMAQLDIPFRRIEKDITRGETRTAEFLAINPNGRIPVLVTPDNRVLPESSAALWYLSRGSKLMPEDAFQQAQILQWMFFEQYNHEPNIATSRYWIHVLGEKQKYAEALAENSKRVTTPWVSWKPICRAGIFLLAAIIPLLTLLCMPTPMWRVRVGFRCKTIRPLCAGWAG